MPKATITYMAPKGDNKVLEMFGHTFFDGQSQEIELSDRELGKLQNNPLFTLGGDPKPAHDKADHHADHPDKKK